MMQWNTNINKINITMQKCCGFICLLTLQQGKCMWFSYHRAEFSGRLPGRRGEWDPSLPMHQLQRPPVTNVIPRKTDKMSCWCNWPASHQLCGIQQSMWVAVPQLSWPAHFFLSNIWAWITHGLHHVLYLSLVRHSKVPPGVTSK